MASKKTVSKKSKAASVKKPAKKAAPKAPKAPKAEPQRALPRHPRARVVDAHTSKAALAKTLAKSLAHADQDDSQIAEKLATASNQQLLRLHGVVETVKEKYGNRAKLIAKLGELEKKAKDKDYLAKLETMGLPQLLDLVVSHERRARA
jgi:hypothetical protein